jgi:hypothetical protein
MDCFHSASLEALCIRSAFDAEQVSLECLNGARCALKIKLCSQASGQRPPAAVHMLMRSPLTVVIKNCELELPLPHAFLGG